MYRWQNHHFFITLRTSVLCETIKYFFALYCSCLFQFIIPNATSGISLHICMYCLCSHTDVFANGLHTYVAMYNNYLLLKHIEIYKICFSTLYFISEYSSKWCSMVTFGNQMYGRLETIAQYWCIIIWLCKNLAFKY